MTTLAPLASDPADRIDRLGEAALLRRLVAHLGDVAPPSPGGPGDDACVLPSDEPRPNVVTVDAVIRGRHFDDALPPGLVGAKLVERNLSDLAAMGAAPLAGVLALLLPGSTSTAWLEAFVDGIAEAARRARLAIRGGDVAATSVDLAATLTVWGHAPRPLLRSGARPGDSLWVTGSLGGSIRGHHATFRARLAEGAWLAARPEVRAAIDVTDGLAKDLPELLPAGTIASLDPACLPVRPEARLGEPAPDVLLGRLLADGEDYELLFAVDARADEAALAAAFAASFPGTPLSRLGRVLPAPVPDPAPAGSSRLRHHRTGLPLHAAPGYEHFRTLPAR